jgi:hypothetical protein
MTCAMTPCDMGVRIAAEALTLRMSKSYAWPYGAAARFYRPTACGAARVARSNATRFYR